MGKVFHLRQKPLSPRLPIKEQELHSLKLKVAHLFILGEEVLEVEPALSIREGESVQRRKWAAAQRDRWAQEKISNV
jgi:hypothetical protein